ncbi:MAG: hypothetical protein ACJ79K_02700 [Gemmatimonadaceae bacterium]
MPNVRRAIHRPRPSRAHRASLVAVLIVFPLIAQGQRPDSAAVRDSIARADSARADSVLRSELARIRAEPRARINAGVSPTTDDTAARRRQPLSVVGASIAGDMVADLSPKAAARGAGSRILMRDIEGALAVRRGDRLTAVVALTLTDDGSTQRLSATDAVIMTRAPFADATLLIGHTALPFGRVSQLHRHELLFPDQPLPVRVLLGETGLRGTGAQLRLGHDLAGSHLSLDLAIADRFGTRIDSLHPAEPTDQSLAGVAAGGRLGARLGALGARIDVGASSITGKREQPIGCVYEATVGPVPCPEAINAANTRLTVFGADGEAAWGNDALVVNAEWMHLIVGATDMPVFSNGAFAPFYRGVSGTYDGGYVGARARVSALFGVGARGEWLQNPIVNGLNDGWLGGFVDFGRDRDERLAVSYQRRVPSSSALAALSLADRDARDRIVIRGTVVIGHHPRPGRD